VIAINLISETVPVIVLSDTGQKALNCMEVLRLSHLPVVKDNAYIGLISDRFIEDLNLAKKRLEANTLPFASPHVHPNQHVYEVASLINKLELSLIPVVDEDHLYLGSITLTDISKHLMTLLSVQEPGGVIILKTAGNNFSASQISQIIEGNDARILSLIVNKSDNSENLDITIKLDKVDLSGVIQTFTRYGYEISAVYMDDSLLVNMYEDRMDLLLKYMNI
jgi:acetoin utilization protein AcuB